MPFCLIGWPCLCNAPLVLLLLTTFDFLLSPLPCRVIRRPKAQNPRGLSLNPAGLTPLSVENRRSWVLDQSTVLPAQRSLDDSALGSAQSSVLGQPGL